MVVDRDRDRRRGDGPCMGGSEGDVVAATFSRGDAAATAVSCRGCVGSPAALQQRRLGRAQVRGVAHLVQRGTRGRVTHRSASATVRGGMFVHRHFKYFYVLYSERKFISPIPRGARRINSYAFPPVGAPSDTTVEAAYMGRQMTVILSTISVVSYISGTIDRAR